MTFGVIFSLLAAYTRCSSQTSGFVGASDIGSGETMGVPQLSRGQGAWNLGKKLCTFVQLFDLDDCKSETSKIKLLRFFLAVL